ncbi:NAD(P)H-hydrate epimerase [Qipengyuania spongiae]|uniref:Bifunctional NAD(P)H-hydrate repair enzyme n=1 Tax=Qipengyuania spongiae TaxID=2909673 RepID=A0ABY5SYR0_9SPHN|nr:NAD(P)H-hydrate epimerase [Qipengyuania spongiae]UVI38996.1 NAD(P)H-hydrate epimerase [Qipengyuania spongiae]
MTDHVLSVEEMRAAERAAMDSGVSEWQLMQRAGGGAADWIWRIAAGRAVTVLCGPGNNGGDGYVIAETLQRRGLTVTVVAPVEPASETARRARDGFSGEIAKTLVSSSGEVLVDCLFGYGLSRKVEGEFAKLLELACPSHSIRIAIDVPSGIFADSGEWLGASHRYDHTLALGAWKRAHFLMPARADMGNTRLVPIGLDLKDPAERLSERPRIHPPEPDSQKYTRGLVAVVAGEMPGAPLLSSLAAMHAGAGYVKLFSDHSHPDAPAELVIEDGALGEALDDERIGAVLIGPGLGRGSEARDRLRAALNSGHNLVLDADALHLLDRAMLDGADPAKMVVTPHDGELAKLCETFDITATDKRDRAIGLRDATGLTVLAKGPDTLLAPAQGGVVYFPQGSSWLSVAGSGDVLAGMIAARLAVTGDAVGATQEAVWLHQEASRLAGPSFTAGQLADAVRAALALFL